MKVKDLMTREVETLRPDATARDAAAKMKILGFGSMPVCDGDRVVGTITDRDLTVRVMAEGRDPEKTRIAEVMTRNVKSVGEEDDLAKVEQIMVDEQVRRLPVVGPDGRLRGYLSTARLARTEGATKVGRVLKGISEPGKPARRKRRDA